MNLSTKSKLLKICVHGNYGVNSMSLLFKASNHHTRNMTGGFPMRAIAVESFLLLPPLYVPAERSLYSVRPSFLMPQSATCMATKEEFY